MNDQNKKVNIEGNSIIINNIILDDANTSKILRDIPEDNREDFIRKAVIIGAIGLRNLYLTENVDYIEKEFKELLNALTLQSREIRSNLEKEFGELLKNSENQSVEIKNMIEKTLDVENNLSSLGKMRVLFENYFDKKTGKMNELLSPFEYDSPIKKLKDEIFQKIQELRDEILKEKATEEIIEKTALKGRNFEEIIFETVENFCSEHEDVVTCTGELQGKLSKIGDLVIDINGNKNKRIVIECKDRSAYSHKRTIDEISDAIENRSATFGIFLFKSQSQIPPALKPLKITNKYIVTSYEDFGLYFAIRLARVFIEKGVKDTTKTIPIEEIQKRVEEISTKLSDFNSIQMKLTQIDNASIYIRTNIDRIKKEIENGLFSIKELLNVDKPMQKEFSIS